MSNSCISKNSHWTESAIECYERGYNCVGCPTQQLISEKCRMKDSVLSLIQIKGLPPKDFIGFFPGINNIQNEIINVIINGADTAEKIAELTGITINVAKYNISQICNFAEVNGKNFLQKTRRLPELVEYLRKLAKNKITNNKGEQKVFDEDLKIKYADFLKPLVDAVKKGFESYDDLTKETRMTKHQISAYWTILLKPLLKDGLIVRNPEKTQKQEVIDFIRNRLIDVQNGNAQEIIVPVKPKLKGKIEIKRQHDVIARGNSLVAIQPSQKTEKADETNEEDNFFLINQPLTKMEHTVLKWLLQGLNYQQIAKKIPIAITTVKTHVNNIFTKRGYHSLPELLVTELNKNNRLAEELNQTKLLLEGKNAQYNTAVDNAKRLQKENESLKSDIEEIRRSSKFTLFEPIEELRMQYSKQIDEWKQLISATKIKLEALKELENYKN